MTFLTWPSHTYGTALYLQIDGYSPNCMCQLLSTYILRFAQIGFIACLLASPIPFLTGFDTNFFWLLLGYTVTRTLDEVSHILVSEYLHKLSAFDELPVWGKRKKFNLVHQTIFFFCERVGSGDETKLNPGCHFTCRYIDHFVPIKNKQTNKKKNILERYKKNYTAAREVLHNNYRSRDYIDLCHFLVLEISPTSFTRPFLARRHVHAGYEIQFNSHWLLGFFSFLLQHQMFLFFLQHTVVKVDLLRQNRGTWKAGPSHWKLSPGHLASALPLSYNNRTAICQWQPAALTILHTGGTEMPQLHAWQPPSELC